MKLHLINRASHENSSFTVTDNEHPNFLKIWHYHPELELVHVKKSTGKRFIGDSIDRFEEGEVILIGKNLPHMWLNEDEYFAEDSTLIARAISIHFKHDFLGSEFIKAPEMRAISELMERASFGVSFVDLDIRHKNNIDSLLHLEGFQRTIKFIELLNVLAIHKNYKLLSSEGFVNSFGKTEHKKMDKIHEFIFKNFNTPIQSKDVAEVANMNTSSFSRFFKRTHRKTFTRYLNEIRVGYGCKLLLEEKNNITAVCYESGFNNVSNFNRQFKEIIGMSPTEYIKYHKKAHSSV